MKASKGKAPAGASPTGPRMDKKGKKVVQTPWTRASARLAALKARSSQTPPPTSSTPAISQPPMKKPIFIVLTKDSQRRTMSSEMIQDSGIRMILMTGEPQNQMLVLRQVAPAILHQTIRLAYHAWRIEDCAHFKCGVVGFRNFHKQFGLF
ncbi:hypothetical protein PIB30_093614 [Stylosanthes scabra]|uniref:Uncharacterized protein n=1 Tax=Stylosanthes scabra TaxID=79078 RepID=A0ABU6QVC2_9FABA|nr:hypothetical protein [Stylosanthes scabra]